MSQRAAAMHGNSQQDQVHKAVNDSALLKMELGVLSKGKEATRAPP